MDQIHFCVFMIASLGLGFVTPPMGLNLFVMSGLTGTPIMAIARRAIPSVITMIGIAPPDTVIVTTNYMQSLAVASTTKLFTVAPRRASEIQQRLGIVKILHFNLDIAPMQVCFINRKTVEGNQSMRLFRQCFSTVVAGERA